MAYGPNSTNPRERRAYAHAKIAELKEGSTTPEVAVQAVRTATNTVKGKKSGLFESLGKAAVVVIPPNKVTTEPKIWVSYTIPAGGAVRRDGYLLVGADKQYLDLATIGNSGCVSAEEKELAAEAWEADSVFLSEDYERHGANTLVLPAPYLTAANVVEALARHTDPERSWVA